MARATRSSAAKAAPAAPPSPPQTPAPPAKNSRKRKTTSEAVGENDAKKAKTKTPATPVSNQKRPTRKAVKQEPAADDDEDLPHNLGKKNLPTPEADANEDEAQPRRKRTRTSVKNEEVVDEPTVKSEEESVDEADTADAAEVPTPKAKTPKKSNYGLTPGQSPYPDYPHPTKEECHEIVRLLEKVHGKVNVPKTIPPPSLDVAGCGEVPSVLDALVRTRLSANTTNKNSSTAFQGLVARFGTLKEGVGKGSVDWDAVRTAPQKDVFKAIQRGGLADRKSKDIQAICQMAYEENQERRKALEKDDGSLPAGAEGEDASERREEVVKAKKNIISLDHLHLLSTDDAINKMLTYPGIGPKTASCVALFCLQRPSFAVDTHVFRLCQYLGWVPKSAKKGQPKVDRNTTYSHCDVRIPDELKYPLHYLLIRHGKTCPRCRAVTGQTSAGWEEGCPIEHLVKRHGAKKGGISTKDRKTAKEAADVKDEDEDVKVEDDESELSDLSDKEN